MLSRGSSAVAEFLYVVIKYAVASCPSLAYVYCIKTGGLF